MYNNYSDYLPEKDKNDFKEALAIANKALKHYLILKELSDAADYASEGYEDK